MNGPYLDPETWKAKNAVLDAWCRQEGRDPKTILRTVNVGFYVGADAGGAARQEKLLHAQWGADLGGRGGFLRGTPKQTLDMLAAYRDAGVARLNIALRQGPYDWDALHAFTEEVLRAPRARRPGGATRGRP